MPTITYHKHHIIPTHAGGTDTPDNIIRLTPKEHAEAHRLLYEEHGRWQDKLAWRSLAGYIGKEEIIQEKLVAVAEAKRGKKRPPRTKEWSKKISEANKGKKHTVEWKIQNRERQKGRVFTEEHKRKLSENHKSKRKSAPIAQDSAKLPGME